MGSSNQRHLGCRERPRNGKWDGDWGVRDDGDWDWGKGIQSRMYLFLGNGGRNGGHPGGLTGTRDSGGERGKRCKGRD